MILGKKRKFKTKKVVTENGHLHTNIELIPSNNDFDVIELDGETKYITIGILRDIL